MSTNKYEIAIGEKDLYLGRYIMKKVTFDGILVYPTRMGTCSTLTAYLKRFCHPWTWKREPPSRKLKRLETNIRSEPRENFLKWRKL
jgi:hypothetical protein